MPNIYRKENHFGLYLLYMESLYSMKIQQPLGCLMNDLDLIYTSIQVGIRRCTNNDGYTSPHLFNGTAG